MNWKAFLKTLAAVAASGAVTGLAQALTTDSKISKKSVATTAGVGAAMAAITYLLKSPLAEQAEQPVTPK